MKNLLIAPSIMDANFACLEADLRELEQAKVDLLHLDIMDGHFVPNITFGPSVVAAVNRTVPTFLEIHAMVYNPTQFVETLVSSGADRIIIHFEATEDIVDTLSYIRKCGIEAGVAFSPETSPDFIPQFVPYSHVVLIMSVVPGFSQQSFIGDTVDKIRYVKQCIQGMGADNRYDCKIEVDGGINPETARLCRDAGADIVVASSYLLRRDDSTSLTERVNALRGC